MKGDWTENILSWGVLIRWIFKILIKGMNMKVFVFNVILLCLKTFLRIKNFFYLRFR